MRPGRRLSRQQPAPAQDWVGARQRRLLLGVPPPQRALPRPRSRRRSLAHGGLRPSRRTGLLPQRDNPRKFQHAMSLLQAPERRMSHDAAQLLAQGEYGARWLVRAPLLPRPHAPLEGKGGRAEVAARSVRNGCVKAPIPVVGPEDRRGQRRRVWHSRRVGSIVTVGSEKGHASNRGTENTGALYGVLRGWREGV
jgi:hypothetical protein